jgi:major membrane immunogen (membrane-anchored lipoprotein)
MVKRILVSVMVIAVLLAGCAGAKSTVSESPQATRAAVLPAAESGGAADEYAQTASQAAEAQRLVIMNASLSIVVKDPAAGMATIDAMATSMGGYVVNSNLYRSRLADGTEVPTASITVRVPAEKLTQAMENIKSLVADRAKDIQSENVTGQDVTKEYTDLNSQLVNLQKAEKQLQQIMENATKTDDVLNVFNQLTQIRGQIEVIQGQMKYYEDAAAMSAVTVQLVSTASIQPLSIGGWQPAGVVRNAVQALINFARFLVNAIIWIGLFCLPVVIVLGVPGYFLVRTFLRWRKARKARAAATAAGEAKPAV